MPVPRRQQVEIKFGTITGLHKLNLHIFDRKESQCAIKTSKTSGGSAQELENRLQIAIFTQKAVYHLYTLIKHEAFYVFLNSR